MQHPSRTCHSSNLSHHALALRPRSWITPSPIFFCSVRLVRGLMTRHLSGQSADCESLLAVQHCWGGGRSFGGGGEESSYPAACSLLHSLSLKLQHTEFQGEDSRLIGEEEIFILTPWPSWCICYQRGFCSMIADLVLPRRQHAMRRWGSCMLFNHTCRSFPSLARESQAMWPYIWLSGKESTASGIKPARVHLFLKIAYR